MRSNERHFLIESSKPRLILAHDHAATEICALHAHAGSHFPEPSCCTEAMIVFTPTLPRTARFGPRLKFWRATGDQNHSPHCGVLDEHPNRKSPPTKTLTYRLARPPVDACNTRRYCQAMKADVPKLTLFLRILSKVRELFNRPTDVHYTSAPIWRPSRRF